MAREFLDGTWQKKRSFSPALITSGPGRTIWIAGHGGLFDKSGNILAGDFEARVHRSFANITETPARVGATLADIVSMTVYIGDARHGDRFVEMRAEYFPNGFPASTLITVTGFAGPEMMVEITPVAVVEN